jgi:hypothetical protein
MYRHKNKMSELNLQKVRDVEESQRGYYAQFLKPVLLRKIETLRADSGVNFNENDNTSSVFTHKYLCVSPILFLENTTCFG